MFKRTTILKGVFTPTPVLVFVGGVFELGWLMWLGVGMLALVVLLTCIERQCKVSIFNSREV